ncbi:hypothetical protein [Palleronia rufa]|uniref:hypothetical protein n=1 Tax=Palleronia rufa TaxID=1530186 RepID=UPI000561329E|nr:hypothetical protein [Palleronia rufa]
MASDLVLKLVSEDGPWVLLVFYLLWRDAQKDAATREALSKNTAVLIEMATLLRTRVNTRGYMQ